MPKDFINFLRKAKQVVWNSPEPWKTKKMGRRPYSPRTLVLCNLLKERFSLTYRETEALISSNRELRDILELKRVPGKSTLQRALEKIPEKYFKGLLERLTREVKKGI